MEHYDSTIFNSSNIQNKTLPSKLQLYPKKQTSCLVIVRKKQINHRW